MSDQTTNLHDLAVTISSDGGDLSVTPRSLLEYFLPGATPLPDRPNVFEGRVPGKPDRKCYVQTEALAGLLLDCREKSINPISDCYLIPSNSPDKRAGHKVKYSVGIERMRNIPGFLGINSGLVVERDQDIQRRNGRMAYPGDTVLGAWAKAYFAGMPEPIEHEVDLASCEIEHSPVWKERPGFMLLKVVEDELWRLKVAPLRAKERVHADGEALLLEAQPLAAPPPESPPQPPPSRGRSTPPAAPAPPPRPRPYAPGTLYPGTVLLLSGPSGLDAHGRRTPKSRPGMVTLTGPDGDPLACFFWTPPAALADPAAWPALIGKQAVMSFREKTNDRGTVFRFIDTLDIATEAAGTIPAEDAPAQPAPAKKEAAA